LRAVPEMASSRGAYRRRKTKSPAAHQRTPGARLEAKRLADLISKIHRNKTLPPCGPRRRGARLTQ
jgi:hypothetical protein